MRRRLHVCSLEFPAAERDHILDIAQAVPTILVVHLDRPAILTELAACDAIVPARARCHLPGSRLSSRCTVNWSSTRPAPGRTISGPLTPAANLPGEPHLRVLIANERRDRLELLAQVVIGLGHDVIAREIYVKEVGPVTAREHPDVALVGLGSSSEHALELITEIVREASCPVIAILHADDPAYVREAAKRGVFAYIIDGTADELQSAIDITLQRFAEYQSLQGAFGRRALIEQAKGILMERHSISANAAFERLRDHSQHNGRKLSDVAAAVVESHLLLLPSTPLSNPPVMSSQP